MTAYLLAWNPKRWPWHSLEDHVDRVERGDYLKQQWSCSNNTRIRLNDRVFLIRLGVEPKGIMGSGTVTQERFEARHYDPDRAARGDLAGRVMVRFDTLLNPECQPLLSLEFLQITAPFSTKRWTVQGSGTRIEDPIAAALEREWTTHTLYDTLTLPDELPAGEPILEGAIKQIAVNAYERNPEARRRCIAHYGPRCVACGFNFAETYGYRGKDPIHVHHLRPLATIGTEYVVDPIVDLCPVCPNCHAIIHRNDPPHSIEAVRSFLHDVRTTKDKEPAG